MIIEKNVTIFDNAEKLLYESNIHNARGLILARVREEMVKEAILEQQEWLISRLDYTFINWYQKHIFLIKLL